MEHLVIDKNTSACFTGHRSLNTEKRNLINKKLDDIIEELIQKGIKLFMAGGAIGFDALASYRIIAAKKKYPFIKFYLVLPCRDQTIKWRNTEDLFDYKEIKGNADKITYISDFYTSDCMMKRNFYMVDNSTYCIAYLKRNFGGSASTVKYANKKGLSVINIATNI